MNILSLSHSLPLSNGLACVKYLSWRLMPVYWGSSISVDFNTWHAHEREGNRNWYVKRSHPKGINQTIVHNEMLMWAVIGLYVLLYVCSLFIFSLFSRQMSAHEIHFWNMSNKFESSSEWWYFCEGFGRIDTFPPSSHQFQPRWALQPTHCYASLPICSLLLFSSII